MFLNRHRRKVSTFLVWDVPVSFSCRKSDTLASLLKAETDAIVADWAFLGQSDTQASGSLVLGGVMSLTLAGMAHQTKGLTHGGCQAFAVGNR